MHRGVLGGGCKVDKMIQMRRAGAKGGSVQREEHLHGIDCFQLVHSFSSPPFVLFQARTTEAAV